MKKIFVIIMALVFVFTVALIGCEKKQEAPKAESQPVAVPAPAPAPAPAAPAPAAPAPSKPAKK